jgi:hypothetical protein
LQKNLTFFEPDFLFDRKLNSNYYFTSETSISSDFPTAFIFAKTVSPSTTLSHILAITSTLLSKIIVT